MIAWGVVVLFILAAVYVLGMLDGTWQLRSANKAALRREQQLRLERYQRDGEPFKAMCNCPKCGVLEFHWIELRSKFAIPRDGSHKRICRTCGFTWKQR